MNKNSHTQAKDHIDEISDHAHALVEVTKDIADEKVVQIRERLSQALNAARDTYEAVQEKAVYTAKATDKVIRAKPYQAMGIALGLGALLGFFMGRRKAG